MELGHDGVRLCVQAIEKYEGQTALLKNAFGSLRAITCQVYYSQGHNGKFMGMKRGG